MRSLFFLIVLFCSFYSCTGFYRTYSYKTPSGVKLKGFIFKGHKIPAQLCFNPFKEVKYSLLLGTEKKEYKVPYLRAYDIEMVDTIPSSTIYSDGKTKITRFGRPRDGDHNFGNHNFGLYQTYLYFTGNRLRALTYSQYNTLVSSYEADSSNNPRKLIFCL
jgi:hypothetical protein